MVRKAYVDIPDGQVHVWQVAGSGIPVVFLHQTASSGQMWLKVMARLAGRWPLFAFDTPGFGGSFDPAPDARPAMRQYVDWLHAAMRTGGVARCHLVGHHTGACLAVELAAHYPEAVQSATLIGPVPLTGAERQQAAQQYGAAFTPTKSGAYLLDNWEYLRQLKADRDVLLLHRELVDQLRAWRGRVQAYRAMWEQDFTTFYTQVRCPLLIGAATEDVLHPYLARARALRPDAEVLEIEGADFEPDLDAERFADGLAAFLAKHS